MRGLLQVEDVRRGGRDLQRGEFAFGRERREPLEGTEPRIGIDELRDEEAGSPDGPHARYFPASADKGGIVTQVFVRVDSMQASMNASPSAPVMASGAMAASGSGGWPLRRAETRSAKST